MYFLRFITLDIKNLQARITMEGSHNAEKLNVTTESDVNYVLWLADSITSIYWGRRPFKKHNYKIMHLHINSFIRNKLNNVDFAAVPVKDAFS